MIVQESPPLVSIIIVNYNGERFLERCLSSILSSDYTNFEIIFVDNASTDKSIPLAKKYLNAPSHKLIINPKNLGHSEGNNIGIKVAKGKYIVFLDNDIEVEKNWLKELVKIMESNPKVGAAQPTLLLNNDFIWATGAYIDRLGWVLLDNYFERNKEQDNCIKEIFSGISAALIVRRNVLKEIGGFDSDFFVYYNDLDLCWRMKLKGYKVVTVPQAIVYHKLEFGKKSLDKRTLLFHYVKNSFIMLIKNYESRNLYRYLPLTIISRLFFAAKRERFLITIKALLWIILNFKKIWLKRLLVQYFLRSIPDSVVMKHMLHVNIFPKYVAYWFFHYRHNFRLHDFQLFLNRIFIRRPRKSC